MKKMKRKTVFAIVAAGLAVSLAIAIPVGLFYGGKGTSTAAPAASNPYNWPVSGDEYAQFQPGLTEITDLKPSQPAPAGNEPWSDPVIKNQSGEVITPAQVTELPKDTYVTANYTSKPTDPTDTTKKEETYTIAVKTAPEQTLPVKQSSPYLARDVVQHTNELTTNYPPSPYIPTGYFIEAGKEYTITLNIAPRTNDRLVFGYGQYGLYSNLNGGRDTQITDYPKDPDNKVDLWLTEQTTKLTPAFSGILYLRFKGDNKDNPYKIASITGEGLKIVPTYYAVQTGETDAAKRQADSVKRQASFLSAVSTTDSPFVEVVGQHTFATMQTSVINNLYNVSYDATKTNTLDENARLWDKTITDTDEFYGMQRTYPNANNYMLDKYFTFVNPDTLANKTQSGATATFYRINMQKQYDTGARFLFQIKENNSYYIWHELNHTYQSPFVAFASKSGASVSYDFGEVAANIGTGYLEFKNKYASTDYDATALANIKSWVEDTMTTKNYFTASESELAKWPKVAMFYQLVMAFGDKYWARLMQEYRNTFFDNTVATGSSDSNFINGSDVPGMGYSEQLFPVMASKIADRDLTPYFEKWKYPLSSDTKTKMAVYKKLETQEPGKEIWYNLTTDTPTKIYDVAYDPVYLPEIAALTTKNNSGIVNAVSGKEAYEDTIQNAPGFSLVKASVNGMQPNELNDLDKSETDNVWLAPRNTMGYIVAQEGTKTPVGYRLQVKIDYDNTLRVLNWGTNNAERSKSTRLLIAIDQASSQLVIVPNGYGVGAYGTYTSLASFQLKPAGGGPEKWSLQLNKSKSSLTTLLEQNGVSPNNVLVKYAEGDVLSVTMNVWKRLTLGDYTPNKQVFGNDTRDNGTTYEFTITNGRFVLTKTIAPTA